MNKDQFKVSELYNFTHVCKTDFLDFAPDALKVKVLSCLTWKKQTI